eukprot:snap_masked-scaffold_28-processed-gene-0.6-mRNA-1 protein AED:1.00 eAED:1.00 QI:0/0/0/0/1/1/3/0/105
MEALGRARDNYVHDGLNEDVLYIKKVEKSEFELYVELILVLRVLLAVYDPDFAQNRAPKVNKTYPLCCSVSLYIYAKKIDVFEYYIKSQYLIADRSRWRADIADI